ncbi:S24 family peptidase [Hyphomicrobium sp.]|uniref:S24 family peptidase n=1 Tax=Hyphomicrobium sp. TaxID=82 RepID=UPI0039E52A96
MPDLIPFDICVIDPDLRPNKGDFVFVQNKRGGSCIRQYRPVRGPELRFELIPSNKDYPAYEKRKRDGVRIAGVVVEFRRTVRERDVGTTSRTRSDIQ